MNKIIPREIFKKVTEKMLFGKYKLAISNLHLRQIIDIELSLSGQINNDEQMQKAKDLMTDKVYLEHLAYLESNLNLKNIDELNATQGRTKEYTSISHHIWVVNSSNPKDIYTYKAVLREQNEAFADKERLKPLYKDNKFIVPIDDEYNLFTQSLWNLEKGAKSSNLPMTEEKFYHVLWTNLSIEEVIKNQNIKSLRKIYGIEKSQRAIPEFIVLNINDVMDKDVKDIKNLAKPKMELPQSLIKGIAEMKQDLLSVKDVLNAMINKKMFASVSDIIRIAAVKDIGGIYFDVDNVLFDQDLVHTEQKKYNLFDIMKNYNLILAKEAKGFSTFANGFISSPTPHSPVLEEAWNMLKRNTQHLNDVPYLKYARDGFSKIICQTGPVSLTLAFFKKFTELDMPLAPGKLIQHWEPVIDGVGILGYDVCGGTWVPDALMQKQYVLFDENDKGITYDEWSEMGR